MARAAGEEEAAGAGGEGGGEAGGVGVGWILDCGVAGRATRVRMPLSARLCMPSFWTMLRPGRPLVEEVTPALVVEELSVEEELSPTSDLVEPKCKASISNHYSTEQIARRRRRDWC